MGVFLKCIGVLFVISVTGTSASDTKYDAKYDAYFNKNNLNGTNIKSHLMAEYTSRSGLKVHVFDGMISYAHLTAARTYFSSNDNWRFVLFDKYVIDPSGKFDHGNGIPWKSWQNPTVVGGTRLGLILKSLVDSVSANSTENNDKKRNFQMTEVYSAISRRGDVTQLYSNVNTSANNTDASGYSAVIYTNTIWRKNSYGEMLFYEDDSDFDVFSIVSPHYGRIVIWDDRIRYLARPPSIPELSGQYMIFAHFQSEPNLIRKKRMYFENYLYDLKKSGSQPFVCNDNIDEVPSLDLDKHLTLRRFSKAGESVSVFDGLFNGSDLDALRTYTVKYGKYFYDDHLDLSSDNVQWIAGFNVDQFVHSRFWPVIKQVAEYVSGKDSWYPYDVACNLIRSADHTRFHLDTSDEYEEEMTFLLYLSPNWTAENYGETAFMEKNFDAPDNDYVAEVVPLYGRAVIFGGNFPHSAHPPAPNYGGPRYTFAVKLSIDKWEAVSKTFQEESRHSMDHIDDMIKEIQADPTTFASKQKVSIVASYLATKQIQQILGESPKTTEDIEEAINKEIDIGDDDGSHLISLVTGELDINLDKANREIVMSMAKHYGLDGKLNEAEESDKEKKDSHPKIVPRDIVMAKWKRGCKKDTDCLSGYLDLFLKQQDELKKRATRDLLAIL